MMKRILLLTMLLMTAGTHMKAASAVPSHDDQTIHTFFDDYCGCSYVAQYSRGCDTFTGRALPAAFFELKALVIAEMNDQSSRYGGVFCKQEKSQRADELLYFGLSNWVDLQLFTLYCGAPQSLVRKENKLSVYRADISDALVRRLIPVVKAERARIQTSQAVLADAGDAVRAPVVTPGGLESIAESLSDADVLELSDYSLLPSAHRPGVMSAFQLRSSSSSPDEALLPSLSPRDRLIALGHSPCQTIRGRRVKSPRKKRGPSRSPSSLPSASPVAMTGGLLTDLPAKFKK
jgi:hypothetical protein